MKGVNQFSRVSFRDELDYDNPEFFKATTKTITPDIHGNDATVSFSKLKLKSVPENLDDTLAERNIIIQRNVTVTMHEWVLFESVQTSANLSLKLINDSLHPKYNEDMIFAAGEGAGRSGSFFFFSHDKRFIIKTMSKSELKLMRRILPDYVEHFKNHPYSLIAKIFGVFTVKVASFSPVIVMLMENTLRTEKLDKLFDLKGSWVDRCSMEFTMKDTNWLQQKEKLLTFDARMTPFLKFRLEADIKWLQTHNLMDYSMLLGIESRKPTVRASINRE